MRDKGIEIVVALLEKRESILVTKDSGQGFVKELLRAESLGYAQKEGKNAIFTLSEKGRRLVNSGYNFFLNTAIPGILASKKYYDQENPVPFEPDNSFCTVIMFFR